MFKLQVKEVHPGSCFGIELAVIDFKYRGKTFVGSISYAFSEIALILYETNLPQCQFNLFDLFNLFDYFHMSTFLDFLG